MLPRPLLAATIVLAAALAQVPAALAGVNAWSAGRAIGGDPTIVAIQGQRAFLGARNGGEGGGLLGSTDGGATWHRLTSFGYRDVTGIAIDPAAAQPVYATTFEGVFRSLDRGATWAEISGGNPTGQFWSAVAADRGRPGTAFFARFSTDGGGVFRTTTGGAGSWANVSGGLGMIPLLDGIVVDPATHVAWGWQGDAGIFRLDDGATTWTKVVTGLPMSTSPRALAVDGPGARVVALTTSGAYTASTTGAVTWTQHDTGLMGSSLATYLLSGSADAAGVVYATSLSRQAWKLPSGATTWEPVDGGLPGSYAGAVVGDPAAAGRALAVTAANQFAPFLGQGPLWRTTDGGDTFTRASTGVEMVNVRDVAPQPRRPHAVLAATVYDGVQRSTDGGATWRSSGPGLPVGDVWDVAFDGGRVGVAYAATVNDGLYRSTDSGATWSHLTASPNGYYVLATDPRRAQTVYVGAGQTIYRSTNLGASFTPLPTMGLPNTFFVSEIVADPDAPGAIWAVGGQGGVYRLGDGASAWSPRASGLGTAYVTGVAFDPHSAAMLVATLDGGVFRSANRTSWTPASTGIAAKLIGGIAYDPLLANVAYAATMAGVYRSTNGGASWAKLGGGIPLPYVQALRFDADGRTLYGATAAIGVVARTRVVAPAVRTAPKVTGTPRQGRILRGRPGTFTGTAPAITYGWTRCNLRGRACRVIAGAHRLTHRVVAGDSGYRLRFVVTARNGAGKAVVSSKATARVRARPGVTATPKLSGTARVGARMRVRFTVHAFPAATVGVRWQRCGRRGRGCVDVGVTGLRYLLGAGDRGHRLRAVVTLRNAFGRTVATSAASAVVR